MSRKNKKTKKKRFVNNNSLYLKYSDVLDDLLNEGYDLQKSIYKINSLLGKNNKKIQINKILKTYKRNLSSNENYQKIKYL